MKTGRTSYILHTPQYAHDKAVVTVPDRCVPVESLERASVMDNDTIEDSVQYDYEA